MKQELAADYNREATLQATLGMRELSFANHARAVDISRELSAANPSDYELRFALALAQAERADAYVRFARSAAGPARRRGFWPRPNRLRARRSPSTRSCSRPARSRPATRATSIMPARNSRASAPCGRRRSRLRWRGDVLLGVSDASMAPSGLNASASMLD